MPLYLCVDCGGTNTAAAISDEAGNIVGRGSAGRSNISYVNVTDFITTITKVVAAALQQHNPSSTFSPKNPEYKPLTAAWFGISGADSAATIATVMKPLSWLLGIPIGPNLQITNDTQLLAAPLRLHPDVHQVVTVIAGTGSNVVSFKEVGGEIVQHSRVGGWGWMLGDDGGGYDVGREAIRQILLLQDKSSIDNSPLPKSQLIDRVYERFGVTSILDILRVIYQPDPDPVSPSIGDEAIPRSLVRERRISSLPPIVFKAAFDDGDPLARTVLEITAGKLASQIAMILRDVGPSSASDLVEARESIISFGGSLVRDIRYRNMLLENLSNAGHTFKHVVFVDDASAGGAVGLSKAYAV